MNWKNHGGRRAVDDSEFKFRPMKIQHCFNMKLFEYFSKIYRNYINNND